MPVEARPANLVSPSKALANANAPYPGQADGASGPSWPANGRQWRRPLAQSRSISHEDHRIRSGRSVGSDCARRFRERLRCQELL